MEKHVCKTLLKISNNQSSNMGATSVATSVQSTAFGVVKEPWINSTSRPMRERTKGKQDQRTTGRTKGPQDRTKAICGRLSFLRGNIFCSSIIPHRMGKRKRKSSSFTLSIIVPSETKKTSGYQAAITLLMFPNQLGFCGPSPLLELLCLRSAVAKPASYSWC